jgi:hypothetical protein
VKKSDGPETTIKSFADIAVFPATVTEIFPVTAPGGTVIVIDVVEAAVTVVTTFPILTTLSAMVELKFSPVITTSVGPARPAAGVKLVITGSLITTKSFVELTDLPSTVTEILPVTAPLGIVIVRDVAIAAVTVAVAFPTLTTLSPTFGLKFWPVMVTVVPMGPVVGINPDIVGSGSEGKGSSSLSLQALKSVKNPKTMIANVKGLKISGARDLIEQPKCGKNMGLNELV